MSIIGNWTSVEDVVDRIFTSRYAASFAMDATSIDILVSALTTNEILVSRVLGIPPETVGELRDKIISTIERNRTMKAEGNGINIQSFTIYPSIDDCFDAMLVEVVSDEVVYYVPSWHYNVSFNTIRGGRLDVSIEKPVHCNLGTDFDIDENNNILITRVHCVCDILKTKSDSIDVIVGNRVFNISVSDILLRRSQTHTFRGRGIPRISEDDIYNFNDKSDVVVTLILDDLH